MPLPPIAYRGVEEVVGHALEEQLGGEHLLAADAYAGIDAELCGREPPHPSGEGLTAQVADLVGSEGSAGGTHARGLVQDDEVAAQQ